MEYERIEPALFLSRPNRFVAQIYKDNASLLCHVKNTGRCKELLVPGAKIWVQMALDTTRKTSCDLIAVQKGDRLINMDSQAPNKVFGEWAVSSDLFPNLHLLRPETKYGDSRFDFYVEYGDKKAFVEVKGVTLEEDGRVFFPDAPTLRGLKHVRQLMACKALGYEAFVVFVIQMDHVIDFSPNSRTHPAFAQALKEASTRGVHVLALSCHVSETKIELKAFVPVIF